MVMETVRIGEVANRILDFWILDFQILDFRFLFYNLLA